MKRKKILVVAALIIAIGSVAGVKAMSKKYNITD